MNLYKPVAYMLALMAAYASFGGCDTVQTKESPVRQPQTIQAVLEQKVNEPVKKQPKNISYHDLLAWQLEEFNGTLKELDKYKDVPRELEEAARELKAVLEVK